MDREQIKEYLPHRKPMLLLDSAELVKDGVCHATYRIPDDPYYCRGHFPGNPMVPGVILCEIMAQSCFHLFLHILKDHLLVYRSLDGVKFRNSVYPGDLCEIESTLIENKGSLWLCSSRLKVAGKLCAQAQITLAALPKAGK